MGVKHPIRIDDLLELRRCVVTPVVQSMLRDGELEHVVVTFDAPPADSPFPPEPGSVWVRLSACGEVFEHRLVQGAAERSVDADADEPAGAGPPERWKASVWDAQDLADDLYGELWDWIVETRFSRGERRYGDYVVPPPPTTPGSTDG